MSLTHRLAECSLVPSPPGPWDVPWAPSMPPRAGILPEGSFCLDPFAWPRIQVGGTCAGNAVAQAITTGLVLLNVPRVEVSGTGCWAQGQLWGAVEGADVDANAGAWVAKVLEACRVWGWPLRTDHAEEGLQSLDASALGEIVARATGPFTIEHRTVSEADCKAALHEGWTIVTSGAVDEAFAAVKAGGWVDTCISGGGHALLVDGYSPAGYMIRDTWGRGMNEIEAEKKRLFGSCDWMRSRWERRAVRVVRR